MSDAPKFQTNFPDPGVTPLNQAAKDLMLVWQITSLEDLKRSDLPLLPVITIWYRLDEKNIWHMNHYDEGHKAGQKGPRSKVPEHDKIWKNGKWGYCRANLQPRIGCSPVVINKGEIISV